MSKIFLTEVQSITVPLKDVFILVLIAREIKLYYQYFLTSLVKVARHSYRSLSYQCNTVKFSLFVKLTEMLLKVLKYQFNVITNNYMTSDGITAFSVKRQLKF